MTTMTLSAAPLITLFWLLAAAIVGSARARLEPLSPLVSAAAAIVAIVVCAFGYTRLCAPHAGIRHALFVGIAWLLLGIVAEMLVTKTVGRGWYAILGPPDHPLLRDAFLAAWIGAPAMFAWRSEERS